ncbi:MAG: hypothetical protein EXS18_03875 [Verrucomicrobiae bacterium]|nr:hypothetical protein [Verrucomicrobiae bacterium]
MKTTSQEQRIVTTSNGSLSQSRRWLPPILLAAGVLVALPLVNGTAVAAGGNDACAQTTKAVTRACVAGARSDYALALAKCANLADLAARKACEEQAAADLKDELETCKDQFDARQTACGRLGSAPTTP